MDRASFLRMIAAGVPAATIDARALGQTARAGSAAAGPRTGVDGPALPGFAVLSAIQGDDAGRSSVEARTRAVQAVIDAGRPIWIDPGRHVLNALTLRSGSVIRGCGKSSVLVAGDPKVGAFLSAGTGHGPNPVEHVTLESFAIAGRAATALKFDFCCVSRVSDLWLEGGTFIDAFDFAYAFGCKIENIWTNGANISGKVFKLGAAFNANHCSVWYLNNPGAAFGIHCDASAELAIGNTMDGMCIQGPAVGIFVGPKCHQWVWNATYFEHCAQNWQVESSGPDRPRDQRIVASTDPLQAVPGGPQRNGAVSGDYNQSPRTYRSMTQTLVAASGETFANRSWQSVMTAECPFYAVRVVLKNAHAKPVRIGGVAVAASASAQRSAPTGRWLAAAFGGSAQIDLPAQVALHRPSVTFSDLVAVRSVARSDGDPRPYIFARVFVPGNAVTVTDGGAFDVGQWGVSDARTLNRHYFCAVSAGDSVTQSPAAFGRGHVYPALAIDVEFYALGTALTVAGFGDSITDGSGAGIRVMGSSWGHRACAAISTPIRPVCWANFGGSGRTTEDIAGRMGDMLRAGMRPQIVVYSPFSPNDGLPSRESADAARARLVYVLDLCAQNRVLPVITTGLPYKWPASADTHRQELNADIRSLAERGIVVCDFDQALSTGGAAPVLPRAATTDGLHPNEEGIRIMTQVFQAALLQLANNYFRDYG